MTEPNQPTEQQHRAPRPAEYSAQLATVEPSAGAPPAPTAVPLEGPIQDLASAYRYAYALAQSKIIPQDLRDRPHDVLVIVLYGQLLGIPPVVALNTIGVSNNSKPILEGKVLLAKVREAGHTPKIEHGDGKCTVTITRGDTGEVHSEEFTLQMAAKAGLVTITADGQPRARSRNNPSKVLPWETYTQRMLMWRALGWCVDVICPEVKMGFMVEGEESTTPDDRPSLGVAARRRAGKEQPPVEPGPGLSPEEIAAQIQKMETTARPGQYDQNPPCQDAGRTVTDADSDEQPTVVEGEQ